MLFRSPLVGGGVWFALNEDMIQEVNGSNQHFDGIDFFYLDVMSSGLECEFALKAIESYNLPVLVGIHLRDDGKLPSGEKIIDIFKKYKSRSEWYCNKN